MKVICIGKNYALHVAELKGEIPEEPVVFMKPDSALLLNNKPFYLPDFSDDVHHEVEVVVRINKLGKNIGERFAHRYYNEVGVGIDFTARDLQAKLRAKGLPWEKCKAFDGSAVLGQFVSKNAFVDLQKLNFHLDINGATVQQGNTKDMLFSIDQIIAHVSQYVTLKIGDCIYTGTPVGVGAVKVGDRLQAYLEKELLLDFEVK